MPIRDLITRSLEKRGVPVRREHEHPFFSFQREMNRLMDDFFGSAWVPTAADPWAGTFLPNVDIKENDKELVVSAELPGLDDKDVEVLLTDDTLTIKGEKKFEKEDKEDNYHRVERSYGSFNRVIALPADVLTEKAEAKFEKGILSITLPKAEKKPGAKKIPIKT
jgi:HSP20 family protein